MNAHYMGILFGNISLRNLRSDTVLKYHILLIYSVWKIHWF